MNNPFGFTRTIIKDRYALLAPDGFVPSALPGWSNATCIVLVAPAMGANFSQTLITMHDEAQGQGNTGPNEMFAYVLEGRCAIMFGQKRADLPAGGFIYLPPQRDFFFRATMENTRVLLFEKKYSPLAGQTAPGQLVGQAGEIEGVPFMGDDAARLQVLLPDQPGFDMAVNIFTYQPGATLPFVESHVMEHGLMMLSGQGIYRLDADWHPVQAGDAIWMAPYCPQWFVATGKTPASYIYYKDINRTAL